MQYKDLDQYVFNYIKSKIDNKSKNLKNDIISILNHKHLEEFDSYSREMLALALKKRMVIVIENHMKQQNDFFFKKENYENFLYNYIELFIKKFFEPIKIEDFNDINREYNMRIYEASQKFENKTILLPDGNIIIVDDIKVAIEKLLERQKIDTYKLKKIKYRIKKVALLSSLITSLSLVAINDTKEKKLKIETINLENEDFNLSAGIIKQLSEIQKDKTFIGYECLCPIEKQAYIYCKAIKYNIPFNVMMTIAHVESDGKFDNNGKISSTNDYGDFQINIVNHEVIKEEFSYTSEDLQYDEKKNIEAAAYLIKRIHESNKDITIEDIFGIYNGWNNWREKEISIDYVRKCLDVYNNIYNKDSNELFIELEKQRKL